MRAHAVLLVLVACSACTCASSMDYVKEYGVMIDAGSTGSRIHIFEWPRRVFTQLPPPLSTPVAQHAGSERTHPGISTGEPGLDALKTLVTFAKGVLNKLGEDLSTIPIYLKATAGMRVLNMTRREHILAEVRTYLATTGFMFKDSWARVISGEEEGVYGFLTVNYVYGLLLEETKSLGALDLGGASTQITYRPSVDLLANLYNIQLGEAVNEDVYTHSFLYFGQNEALRRANQHIVDTTSAVGTVAGRAVYNSPCYNPGAMLNFTTIDEVAVTINGTGDFAACLPVMSSLLIKDAVCFTSPNGRVKQDLGCSIAGVYQPPLAGDYIAFSGFSYTYDFLKLAPNASLSQLASAASTLCTASYDTVKGEHPKEAAYAISYCAASSYIYALLHDGYGFSDDSHTVTVVPPSSSISYALGSMIYEANALGWQYSPPDRAPEERKEKLFMFLFIGFAALSGLLVLTVCIMRMTQPETVRRRKMVETTDPKLQPMLANA